VTNAILNSALDGLTTRQDNSWSARTVAVTTFWPVANRAGAHTLASVSNCSRLTVRMTCLLDASRLYVKNHRVNPHSLKWKMVYRDFILIHCSARIAECQILCVNGLTMETSVQGVMPVTFGNVARASTETHKADEPSVERERAITRNLKS
jgi:hypothetical protein